MGTAPPSKGSRPRFLLPTSCVVNREIKPQNKAVNQLFSLFYSKVPPGQLALWQNCLLQGCPQQRCSEKTQNPLCPAESQSCARTALPRLAQWAGLSSSIKGTAPARMTGPRTAPIGTVPPQCLAVPANAKAALLTFPSTQVCRVQIRARQGRGGPESRFLTSSQGCWCCWSADHPLRSRVPRQVTPVKGAGSAPQLPGGHCGVVSPADSCHESSVKARRWRIPVAHCQDSAPASNQSDGILPLSQNVCCVHVSRGHRLCALNHDSQIAPRLNLDPLQQDPFPKQAATIGRQLRSDGHVSGSLLSERGKPLKLEYGPCERSGRNANERTNAVKARPERVQMAGQGRVFKGKP